MSTPKQSLREQLAAIEHERWADWQKYMLSLAKPDFNQEAETMFTYTVTQFNRWQRQIETPYSELSDIEKASDMEQVDRYWPLVEAYIATRERAARADEVERFEALDHVGTLERLNRVVLYVDRRKAELQSQGVEGGNELNEYK